MYGLFGSRKSEVGKALNSPLPLANPDPDKNFQSLTRRPFETIDFDLDREYINDQ
jgi:shikimate kinase